MEGRHKEPEFIVDCFSPVDEPGDSTVQSDPEFGEVIMATKKKATKKKATKKKATSAKGARPEPAVTWLSKETVDQLGIDEGSKIVKELAAQQKINVKLTEEQMEAIRSQLKRWDNKRPAEISFLVEGEEKAKFRVAAYAYRRRTCCA
jgi:hypothetical protein